MVKAKEQMAIVVLMFALANIRITKSLLGVNQRNITSAPEYSQSPCGRMQV